MSNKPRYVFDANVNVSGDRDLLVLHPFRGISILTPRSFVDTHALL